MVTFFIDSNNHLVYVILFISACFPFEMADKQNDRLFPNLDADEAENSVTVIQSACLNCHAQGETRLLLTRIPFFKDIILASFSCPSCGFANRSVDTAGMIEDQGVRFELRVRPLSKCLLKMLSRFPVPPIPLK